MCMVALRTTSRRSADIAGITTRKQMQRHTLPHIWIYAVGVSLTLRNGRTAFYCSHCGESFDFTELYDQKTDAIAGT